MTVAQVAATLAAMVPSLEGITTEAMPISVTACEFTFLAMGLVLGVAAGAALIEILRARPPAPREVRVTVAQDAIPRRAVHPGR